MKSSSQKLEPILGIQSRDQMIADLQGLVGSRQWKAYQMILQANIDSLTNDLIDNDSLTNDERNDVRKWIHYLKEMLNAPQYQITMLGGPIKRTVELDPHYKTIEELYGRKLK